MGERLNWMLPSLVLPRVGSLQIRVSSFFFLFAVLFAYRLGFTFGSTVFLVLTISVLLHELGHVLFARFTGGSAPEIHLTPFGGIAPLQPGRGYWTHLATVAAGPLVNLTICLLAFPGYYAADAFWGVLNPLVLPVSRLSDEHLWRDLGLVVFWTNWLLLLVNLLPTLPLDGGRMIRIVLTTRGTHPEVVDRRAVQISIAVGILIAFVGLFFDWANVVFLGAFLFAANLIQMFEDESTEKEEDSFLGYDFSEGYTSLDRSAPPQGSTQAADAQRGLLERWRERRRLQQEQALRRQQEEAERQLDELLAKVHEHGMNSLTRREKRLLRQASDLMRERGKRPT